MWKSEKSPPVWEYLGWTFLITFVSWIISFIGEKTGIMSIAVFNIINTFTYAFAPFYATFIILIRHRQISGAREFFIRIFQVKNLKVSLLILAVLCCAKLILSMSIGERTELAWYIFIPAIPIMILGGGVEEVGWRGFLQPALEKKCRLFQRY